MFIKKETDMRKGSRRGARCVSQRGKRCRGKVWKAIRRRYISSLRITSGLIRQSFRFLAIFSPKSKCEISQIGDSLTSWVWTELVHSCGRSWSTWAGCLLTSWLQWKGQKKKKEKEIVWKSLSSPQLFLAAVKLWKQFGTNGTKAITSTDHNEQSKKNCERFGQVARK